MGGIEDNHWVDLMIDKIGFALTKVDESIQKSIELWKELTKDIYDEQPNNGKPGEEDSSRDKSVAEVKERPIQHWAMRLGEAKESTSQHWSMCDSNIPENLIQEQGDDEVEQKEKEDDEGTVSESSGEEDMCELTLGNSATRYRPNRHHNHKEEASTGLSLKWKDGYDKLKDDDKSWGDDCENLWKSYPRVPLGSWYLPPVHPLHKENNALYFTRGNPYHMSINDDMSSQKDDESWDEEEEEEEINLETSETSNIPSRYHHRNEEDTDSRIRYELLKRARDGYELLKNDDTSSEDDDDEDSWNEEDVMEYWRRKYRVMSDVTNISLVDEDDDDDDDDDIDDDDNDLSDKLRGFVDVKEEEIENKMESGEVDTLSPECDWVYVMRE